MCIAGGYLTLETVSDIYRKSANVSSLPPSLLHSTVEHLLPLFLVQLKDEVSNCNCWYSCRPGGEQLWSVVCMVPLLCHSSLSPVPWSTPQHHLQSRVS